MFIMARATVPFLQFSSGETEKSRPVLRTLCLLQEARLERLKGTGARSSLDSLKGLKGVTGSVA